MPTKTIKGKIIRILDKRTVIINLGRERGIKESSIFYILGTPESVIDPFSKEELGRVTVTKSRVKATQVFEKFVIASTTWVNKTQTFLNKDILAAITSMEKVQGVETVSEKVDEGELNVKESDIQPWKAKSQIPVLIGDEVEVEVEIKTEKPIATKEPNPQPDNTSPNEKTSLE